MIICVCVSVDSLTMEFYSHDNELLKFIDIEDSSNGYDINMCLYGDILLVHRSIYKLEPIVLYNTQTYERIGALKGIHLHMIVGPFSRFGIDQGKIGLYEVEVNKQKSKLIQYDFLMKKNVRCIDL